MRSCWRLNVGYGGNEEFLETPALGGHTLRGFPQGTPQLSQGEESREVSQGLGREGKIANLHILPEYSPEQTHTLRGRDLLFREKEESLEILIVHFVVHEQQSTK